MVSVGEGPLLYELGINAQPPYQSMKDFQFSRGTLQYLHTFGLDERSKLGFAVGANIAAGNDCVIVAEDDRHKKVAKRVHAYLLPILKHLPTKPTEVSDGKSAPSLSGCEVLIICASKTSGRRTEMVAQFLSDCVRPKGDVKTAYCDNLDITYEINPDILITDVESLHLMRGSPKSSYLFTRLTFLVFEEQELYSEVHLKQIPDVIAVAEQHNQWYGVVPFTTVFATTKWTEFMESLFTDIRFQKKRNIVAYFFDTAEIMKFANVNWNLLTLETGGEDDDVRIKLLCGILSKGFSASHTKVAICCTSVEKAVKIWHLCVGMSLNAKIAGCVENAAVMGFSSGSGVPKIIIIPGEKMYPSVSRDCTYLIGFDGDFLKQIHYMTESFPSLSSTTGQIEKKDLVVNFLVTGKEANFFSLYKLAKSLVNVTIADELEKIGAAMVNQELSGMPLCHGIKLFGHCNNYSGSKCELRHEFNERDVQADSVVPCHGKVEFKMIQCKSPSEYIGLLLSFRSNSSDYMQRSFVQERENYVEALNKVAGEEQLQNPLRFENGQTYAVFDIGTNKYRPAKLTLFDCGSARSSFFKFDCLVTGERFDFTDANNVFSIPSSLSHLKPLPPLVTIILCGVRPRESAKKGYSGKECSIVQNLTWGHTYKAHVGLSISNTIWARAILFGKTKGVPVKKGCLKKSMLAKGLISTNPLHLANLVDLLRKLGDTYTDHLNLDRYDNATSDLYHNLGDLIQWRHMEISTLDSIKLVNVKTTYVCDLWDFFGICSEFEQLLNRLEENLTKWVSANNVYANYDVSETKFFQETLNVGSAIAVKIKNEDNEGFSWKRGLVVNVQGADTKCFDIFLVDFGETLANVTKDDISPILKWFVNELPFQAIAFSFDHIEPAGEGISFWDRNAKEALWRILLPDGFNTYFKAVVTGEVMDAQLFCRCYNVLGMYKEQEIGEMMIQNKMAVAKTDMKDWMGIITQALNPAVFRLVENENQDSSSGEEFFDAHENLNDFDVNLDTNGNNNNPVDETIKKLGEKMRQIKLPGKTLEGRDSNGNAKTTINTDRTVFSRAYVCTNVLRIGSVKPTLKKEKPSRYKNKKQTSPTQVQVQRPTVSSTHPRMNQPNVMWHQTPTQVILSVMVSDVKEGEYNVIIDNGNFLTLLIVQPQKSYSVQIQLVGKVVGWTVKLLGHQLRINLDKLNPTEEGWPRLLWDKTEKLHWLTYNKDYIKEEDDENVNNKNALVPMYGVDTVDQYEYGEDNDENLHEIEEDKYFQVPSTSKFNRS